ncbi:VENN motif pre-toxin domain-containing protein [Pantoea ananatis]|nr:VENN motif pre-toxin domain-containing protein [Pantoea ananatis]UYL03696.1 VENN motif pre-toxin domain-containing protein [Pantoea ananatis]
MGTTLRPSTQPHRARVIVGNHPQLDGAVIASTADKDRNVLDTGTLGWRDIQNQADYKSEHQSAGFNTGGPIGSNLLSNVSALPVSAAGGSGHAEGSTKAAVSDGNIIIRNRDAQQQDLSGLSRDTDHANDGSISPIFDKEKEQRRLQQAQLVNDVATQALDVYNTHEAARATRAATASLTDTRTALEAQASAMLDKAHEKDPNVDNSRQAVVSKAWQLAYDQAIVRQGADMGGSVRTGVNAVVNALQALAGGDIRAALAQGAAPYLAAKVKELTTGNAPYGELTDTQKLNNLMAHALLGGVVAELSGGSAAAGATGAVTGELATPAIALALYGTANSDKLSPEQKANLSALATLASGIAAGVATGSTSGAATGALAGKNAVENNSFSDGWNNILPSGGMDYGNAVKSWNQYAEANGLTPEQKQAGLDKQAKGDLPEGANITKVIVNGYKDGVLIAGAAYLGPAASIGKVVAGATVAEIANGTYQWFDINSEKNQSLPENQQKTWDYWGSSSAAVTGALAPGRGVWQNVGIAAGGTIFTDGADTVAVSGSIAGAAAGGSFGKYAPVGVDKLIGGNNIPDFIYDVIGSGGAEVINGFTKEALKAPVGYQDKQRTEKNEKLH